MNEQYFLERQKFYVELLRLVWVSILTIGSGAIGLIVTTLTPLKIFFASLGFAAVSLLAISLIVLSRRIWQNLNKIKEAKDERS